MIHSGRGIQYTYSADQKVSESWEKSYIYKAYHWDNTYIDSFYAVIKRERINGFKVKNYNYVAAILFENIDTFYNTIHIHSHCRYKVLINCTNENLRRIEKILEIES